MPGEGKRSMGYRRPFMSCNDPRGVVERGTLTTAGRELLEVSRGAQKLNHDGLDSSDPPSTSSEAPGGVKKRRNKRRKGFSLIAKLMGFEDASFHSSGRKHVSNGEKVVNQKKPAFDVEESPWKSGWKRRALDQMVEALRFKGGLISESKERWGGADGDHHRPPSSRFSCLNVDHTFLPKPRAEEVDGEKMFLKMKIRTNPLAEIDEFGNPDFQDKKMLDRSPSRSGRKWERKRTPRSESHLQPSDGDKSTNPKPNSSRRANGRLTGNGEVQGIYEMEVLLSHEDSARLAEDASQIEITDYVDDDQSSPSETPSSSINLRSNSESGVIFPNECGVIGHDKESQSSSSESMHVTSSSDPSRSRKGATCENKLKSLLLSSPPFLSRVAELFGFKEITVIDSLQEMGNHMDRDNRSSRMLVDCANELVELHGSECCRACPPLPRSSVSCNYTSLDQLLDEICDGIEALRCYIKEGGDEGHSADSLVVLVKGDLRSGKMATGVWDMGWRKAGSVEEIEEITRGIDELVLDGLIEEILDESKIHGMF